VSVILLHTTGRYEYFEIVLERGDKIYRLFKPPRFPTPTKFSIIKFPPLLDEFLMSFGMVGKNANFLHVRPYVLMHQLFSHWRGSREILY
jgi:hypothetical protein